MNMQMFRQQHLSENLEPGRVIAEHRERYIVATEKGEVEAEITGNMRLLQPAVKIFLLLAIG
jgi:ribosome biogenesis GTPase / thiamine phosphate phosphatase